MLMKFINNLTDQSMLCTWQSNHWMLNSQYIPVKGDSASNMAILTWESMAQALRRSPDVTQQARGQELKHSKGRCFEGTERR